MGRRVIIDAEPRLWALAAKDANRAVLAEGADEIPPSATKRRPHSNDLVRDRVTVRRKRRRRLAGLRARSRGPGDQLAVDCADCEAARLTLSTTGLSKRLVPRGARLTM
jgi:hypothetical protein